MLAPHSTAHPSRRDTGISGAALVGIPTSCQRALDEQAPRTRARWEAAETGEIAKSQWSRRSRETTARFCSCAQGGSRNFANDRKSSQHSFSLAQKHPAFPQENTLVFAENPDDTALNFHVARRYQDGSHIRIRGLQPHFAGPF